MVLVTVPVTVPILDSESDPKLVTYTALPSEVTATPVGYEPTVMVPMTASSPPRREDKITQGKYPGGGGGRSDRSDQAQQQPHLHPPAPPRPLPTPPPQP